MKKMKSLCALTAVLAMAFTLGACEKSEFAVRSDSEKKVVISASKAENEATVTTGALEVAEGEKIVITSGLENGTILVEILSDPENQNMDGQPVSDEKPIITANAAKGDEFSGTVPAGSYQVRATCKETATGTIEVNVKPAQ